MRPVKDGQPFTPDMPGIAIQTAQAAQPRESFPNPDTYNPRAIHWAREMSRHMPHTQGAVLRELAHYVDIKRGDGLVWPSQDTLAANLGISRSTVCVILRILEGVNLIESSTRTDIEGHHKQYMLTGDYTGWQPTDLYGQGRRPIVTLLLDTIDSLRAEAQALKNNSGYPVAQMSPETTGSSSSSNGPEINEIQDNYYYDEEPNVSSANIRLSQNGHQSEPPSKDTPASRLGLTEEEYTRRLAEVTGWTESNFYRLSWEKLRPAIDYYMENYDSAPPRNQSFLEQKTTKEKEDRLKNPPQGGGSDRDKYMLERWGELPGEATHQVNPEHPPIPDNASPEAQRVWNSVMAELEKQLPKSAFQTWLKQTEGVHMDETRFVVSAPTTFAVAWLERRMYNAIQKTVEKVTGEAVEVHFMVAQDSNRE